MVSFSQFMKGEVDQDQLKNILMLGFGSLVACILLARITFPSENDYRIAYDTFSFLGSWDSDNNPVGWYFFTIGLLIWAITMFPVLGYMYKRFAPIAKLAVQFGFLLLFIGALGIAFIAIFPDVHENEVVEGVTFSDIHGKVALFTFGGIGLGYLWLGLMLAKDRFSWFPHGGQKLINHQKIIIPYIFFLIVFFLGAFFLIRWEFVYPVLRDADQEIGSHWSAALGTVYSFPLWENILIYTVLIFTIWMPLTLPKEIPKLE